MRWLEDPSYFNLDCGDNSCKYATKKGGMRTNGGCRCGRNSPQDVERFLMRNYAKALQRIEQLEATIEVDKILESKC